MIFFIFFLVGSRTVPGDFAMAADVEFGRRVGTTRSTDVTFGTGLFQFEGGLVAHPDRSRQLDLKIAQVESEVSVKVLSILLIALDHMNHS